MFLVHEKNEAEELRTKQVLAGLFLSKFDQEGLRELGFSSFTEAFNTIGFALGARPASIKNYRDEFDPIYSKKRNGWRNRPIREYCRTVGEKFAALTLQEFSEHLKNVIYERGLRDVISDDINSNLDRESSFAKRLITGQAAERYFELVQPSIPVLSEYAVENVTELGCGFDYRLSKSGAGGFLAIEVKGLNSLRGTISLTEKEHRVAGMLSTRFYLFLVSNFREKPRHTIYCNPLKSELAFSRHETQVTQINWRVSI